MLNQVLLGLQHKHYTCFRTKSRLYGYVLVHS